MNKRRAALRHLIPALAFLVSVAGAGGGCAELATLVPGAGQPLKVALEREDISALVADYMTRLQASAFWQQTVCNLEKRPTVAVWPVQNTVAQRLDDQIPFLLWAVESSLVTTKKASVVDQKNLQEAAEKSAIDKGAAVDSATAAKLGRQLGAGYFVSGRLGSAEVKVNTERQVRFSLFLQVLDVDTGLIRFQSEVVIDKAPKK